MVKISDSLAGSKNALAFLDMLAWSEGTSISKDTRDDGYDVVVGGIDKELHHPPWRAGDSEQQGPQVNGCRPVTAAPALLAALPRPAQAARLRARQPR